MGMPKIEGPARWKPLCYDPERGKFIMYDEIISGIERIVPLERLSPEDLKRLMIVRRLSGTAGEDWEQPLSGSRMSWQDTVREILNDEEFGRHHVEGQSSYLRDFLRKIEENM